MVKVEVTQQDIDNGKRSSCRTCPIALAISRHLKDGYVPSVGNPHFCIRTDREIGAYLKGQEIYKGELPREVARFISRFDSPLWKGLLPPFSFQVYLPEACLNGPSNCKA